MVISPIITTKLQSTFIESFPSYFPKSNYDINKIKESISLPLDSYKDMSTFEETKKMKLVISLIKLLKFLQTGKI